MKFHEVPIPHAPYIKKKNFLDDLCPIVKYGIPKEADSRRDRKVIGTVVWEEFWKEELYKIHNGVRAGGMDIPGRFYYYMNYGVMSTINGVITPDMVDLHLELAYTLDYCIANGVNLLGAKARRKGISEATHKMVIDYGWRFQEAFKGGVAAGKKVYVEDFLAKWRFGDSTMPPELSIKKLVDNDDEIVAGYSIKNEFNAFEDRGTFNTIYARTMHTNPNMFKGLYLNVVVSEEIGEHERWMEFYSATKDALMSGNRQKGCFIAYGTGGDVNKGSKDFKKLSEEAEDFNFIEFVIPATRFYFYGGATRQENMLPLESDLYLKYKPYQLIGVEDLELSKKIILEKREEKLIAGTRSGNMKPYYEELQNNPLDKKEIFRKTVVNHFSVDAMNNQMHCIDSEEMKRYSRYVLEWERDDNGMIKVPYRVNARPAKPTEPDNICVYIIDAEHPRKNYRSLYTAGIDSYNIDSSVSSKSLGAMVVLIRKNNIPNAYCKAPVAVIRTRPPRKEKFYEMCLQLAVYYDIVGNCLGDIRSAEIVQYWKDWGGEKYLAKRPAKFESEDTTQTTDYWFSINRRSKPEMIGVMQTWIIDFITQCWFGFVIDELQNYDEVEIESDNDAADALGMALIQDVCADVKPKDLSIGDKDDRFEMPDFAYDKHGNLVPADQTGLRSSYEQDDAFFGQD